ncbi:hypothetical protein AB0G79_30305 [Streptomyces sp. NPDC020807]|uniref:hypothetical protein n=1 Tax=Streptomyces sp. NPDC020807 TaxID=3155119 RepID=UPI00340A3B96
MNHADGTAPIYAELIRERGDVPGDVRQAAEEVLRDLSRVIQLPPQGVPVPQGAVAHAGVGAPMGQPGLPVPQQGLVPQPGLPGPQAGVVPMPQQGGMGHQGGMPQQGGMGQQQGGMTQAAAMGQTAAMAVVPQRPVR